jgi:predicted metalloprotease with PDZ domain
MTHVRYALSMPRPGSHLFHVRMEVKGAPGDTTDLVMPVWTPGSYKVRDFARNVQDFSAGRHAWKKVDKSRWRVFAGGDVTVEYDVWAFELSVQTSHLDAEHGFVNGASVFLYADGHKGAPVTLEIRAPKGWRVATGLERRGRLYAAPDYDVFVDCPIEIGTFEQRTFRVRGKPHHLAIHGPGNYDAEALVRDLRKVVETEIRIMRHVPYDQYLFIMHHSPERGGGLEHLNSTALQHPARNYRPREKYENFLELAAHEFFHLWNVKRLRPEPLGPFDYEREVYTSLLWAMEGLTSYYDTLVLCRAGIMTPEKYLKKVAERLQKFEEKPGRRRQSLSASSFDTWIKLYQPNENALNSQMSYYEKGELVGMCLDLEIRRRTEGRRSLDDVMRGLYRECLRRRQGFPEPEFRRACERAAGGSLRRFFADFVDGTGDIPWNRFLGVAGLRLEKEPRKPEEGEAPRKAKPWLGVAVQKGAVLAISAVVEGSPADRAGLSVRDELVALDGARVLPDEWEKRLEECDPGDRLRLTVFRAGYLREFTVTLGRKENVSWVVRKAKRPAPLQKKIYQGWLWAPWKKP